MLYTVLKKKEVKKKKVCQKLENKVNNYWGKIKKKMISIYKIQPLAS
jgi:hypothetical protein